MIDRQGGKILIECDSCSDVFDAGTAEWVEVWDEARRDGWTAEKIGNDWIHRCQSCNQTLSAPNRMKK